MDARIFQHVIAIMTNSQGEKMRTLPKTATDRSKGDILNAEAFEERGAATYGSCPKLGALC